MMKELNPKVSIVIPVYNGSNFMGEAIDSALAQTYKNLEIIVVNDGSTDDGATEKIAMSYGDKIRYFPKKNGGVATALNYGIQNMTGAYFSWLSHDDMYEKTKIEEQVKVLRSFDGDNVIVACNAKVLFPNGIKKNEFIDTDTFRFIDIFLATSAVVGINGCALLIPKKALVESSGFDANLPATQDYDLWFRLKDNNKFVLLEKNLVISRRHDGQDSVQKQKMCFDAGDKLHYDFLDDIPYERFEQFFNAKQNNIASYWENYIIYKQNGYKKTASMMLRYILRYYLENNPDKFNEVFTSEIGNLVQPGWIGKNSTKKKLMFYSNVWHKGGIERVLSIMLSYFKDKYDCVLAINEDNFDNNLGFKIPKSVSYIKINYHRDNAKLMNLASTLDIDLFVGNPNISEAFLNVYEMFKETRVKSIAYNHGYYFLPYMCGEYLYPVALKTKEAYRSADKVVWLTQVACNLYNVENDNGVFIPNPSVTDKLAEPKQTANKKILAVGRFDDEIKQIDKTLLVYKEIHKIDPEYHLDVVGYCPMDIELPNRDNITLKQFIAEQDIPVDNIEFWGEQENVSGYYNNASFLILTSRCEGFGMVFLEALSKGLPCASFEYLGIEELLQNGHNAWVRPSDDYVGLAKDIDRTIQDKKLYFEMSQNALQSVERFSLEKYFEKWDKLIEVVLGEGTDTKHILEPSGKLTVADFKKITLEYESMLKKVADDFLNKEFQLDEKSVVVKQPSRLKNINLRFIESISRDGVYLTGEKIVRKVHKKLIKRQR